KPRSRSPPRSAMPLTRRGQRPRHEPLAAVRTVGRGDRALPFDRAARARAIERDPGGRVAPAGGLAAELGEFLGVDDREPAGAGAAEVDDGDRAGRRLAGGLEDPGPGPRRLLPLAFGVPPHA